MRLVRVSLDGLHFWVVREVHDTPHVQLMNKSISSRHPDFKRLSNQMQSDAAVCLEAPRQIGRLTV